MDKDILRLVIIAMGFIVILAMLLWSYWKGRKARREGFYFGDRDSVGNIDPSLALHPEHDDFDVMPKSYREDDEDLTDFGDYSLDDGASESNRTAGRFDAYQGKTQKSKEPLPALIQFSLVAVEDEGFSGSDLAVAFDNVGLVYGNIKIFERLDRNGLVDFGVASMVEPGIFPDTDLDKFTTPGLVFFMQPREVDDPVAVFDDFIETIDILADELGGVPWDDRREPLTDETVEAFRNRLALAN
ncbi:MAG: hypothetical protein Kow0065_01250 [Methylomicrobium sp.]